MLRNEICIQVGTSLRAATPWQFLVFESSEMGRGVYVRRCTRSIWAGVPSGEWSCLGVAELVVRRDPEPPA